MIIAKPVVPNQYWILQQNDRKIGNIQAESGGFTVKIGDTIERFNSMRKIRQLDIDFQKIQRHHHTDSGNKVHGFPTTARPHNAIYDVKHQVPLWTKDPRSKSWYAAGWYRVKQGRNWQTVQCPKLITLQRYPYQGPYRTAEEAEQ